MNYHHLDASSHEQLDENLVDLHQRLNSPTSHTSIVALARTIIESVAGKLLRPRWKSEWRAYQTVFHGWFGDINQDREARALHAVFVETIRCVEEATTPPLQKRYQQQLLDALDEYMDWRGIPTGQGINGSDPFADLPSKQRKLLDALWCKGKVSIPDLLLAVYDDEFSDPETLRILVRRTNAKLSEKHPSLQIKKVHNGGYTLEDV